MSKNITHEGIVTEVNGQFVTVRFVQNSACSECRAKALCTGGTSESEIRQVVANSYGVAYELGEMVRVVVSGGLAWSAVIVAFAVPIILALSSLAIAIRLTGSEVQGVIYTFGVLTIYYLAVWLMRHRLERRVEFTLERM